MPVSFYFDHNVNRAVTDALRLRGVDLLTAFEDGTSRLGDPELLDRATTLGRVLFSTDSDLLAEARKRQHRRASFTGLIFARQALSVRRVVDDLELIAGAARPEELADTVLFLPLR